MKKILFLCDGSRCPKGAFEFVKLLNDEESVYLKGLFFDAIDFKQLIPVSYMPLAEPYIKLKSAEKETALRCMELFKKDCAVNDIRNVSVFEHKEWNREILINETRFADALMLSGELFYNEVSVAQPNLYLQEALHCSECPVIAVPESFKSVDSVVVAYDGKKESMLAFKQFCYLMPQFAELPIEIVYIREEKSHEIPDLELLREFTRLHFNSSAVSKLHFNAYKDFTKWVKERKNTLIVAGAFGRSSISNLIRSSFTHKVIHDHQFPLFIAHNN